MRVLLVAPEDEAQHLMDQVLRWRGHHVSCCATLAAALEAMQQEPFPLLVVQAPPSIPDLNRFIRLLGTLAGASEPLMLVVLNESDRLLAESVLGAGADECLLQPLDVPLLNLRLARIERLCQRMQQFRQADLALSTSERRYAAMADSSAVGIWEITPDGYTIYLNRAMSDLLELGTIEDVRGLSCYQFLTSPSEERMRQEHALRRHGVHSSYEVELVGKRGRRRHVLVSGAPVLAPDGTLQSMIATVVDISDRRQAEQALRESEERYRLLFESGEDLVMVFSLDQERHPERYLEVNHTACARLGYDRDEMLAMPPSAAVAAGQEELLSRVCATLHRDRHCLFELRLLTRDGVELQAEVNAHMVDLQGHTAVMNVARDMTSRLAMEEERRQLEVQIQHAQKLESLGVLAGGIAHDFNNLLMGVLGNAGLALAQLPEDWPARESVQQIELAALRAAELTRQLLAYSGKGRFDVRPLNLSRLVEETTHLLQVSITKKSILSFHLDHDVPSVEGDPGQLRQVIMNLITNASDALSEQPGVITISTGVAYIERAYFADTYLREELPEGRYVFVEVADTGVGMDSTTLSRIFDPFFTTKFTGRGLGLAAVLGIVRSHHGAVRVRSRPGRGTTFRVILPSCDRVAEELLTPGEFLDDWRGQGRVLVVDDEPSVRDIARRLLEHAGLDVVTADDGLAAVDIYTNRSQEFDVVLLDLTMPRMGGEEALLEMLRIRPDSRIVLTSGFSEEEVGTRLQGLGMAGFVQKPYEAGALLRLFRQLLDGDSAAG